MNVFRKRIVPSLLLLLATGTIFTAGGALTGCGFYRTIFPTHSEYLVKATDTLALPNEPVTLRIRLQEGALLHGESDYTVRFIEDGKLLATAITDRDGVATTSFTPSALGDYRILAEFTPDKSYEKPPQPVELLVCCRTADAPMLVVDLDKTVVASGFGKVLSGEALPMKDSAEVMTRLAERYTVVYLTHRPEMFGPTSKLWLKDHGYPRGPMILSTAQQFAEGSGPYKTAIIAQLRGRFRNLDVGIGDKFSDAQAYRDNGLKAVLIIQPERLDAEDTRDLAGRLGGLPEDTQVVSGWPQIEDVLLRGADRPRALAQRELEARATELGRGR